ncbi:hypothetical protein DIC82_05660 [Clostridium beijerinckii]|nr:hypothetical protein DIC82_05660 [Clostridium beijerinckii]
MNNYLRVNDVIKYNDNDTFIRIVWIESDNTYCYTINLFVEKLEINYMKISELLEELKNKNAELIEYIGLKIQQEESLGIRQRELLKLAINVVEDIFTDEPNCYNSNGRKKRLTEVSEKHGIAVKTTYKYMRRYLQGGKIKYALINDLNKCGGKEKERKPQEEKRGRPSYISVISGKTIGINVDSDIEKKFKKAIDRYYMNTKERSLPKVYGLMLKDYFFYEVKEKDKLLKKIRDSNEIPSFGQFKYWFYKNKKLDEFISKRIGQKKFDLNYRRLKSDSIYETMGAGARYQIDATVADVYLINSIDRGSVIGRPIVYLIIDVYSRMITGVAVTLEGPSWNGASLALYNCMEDKVEFCKKYDILIKEEDWDVRGIPQVLIADRGEMVGPIAEKVVENLKISIENTPSYMGCAKGIVEQYFHVINTEIKHWLPGEVKKEFRERGEKDYRLEATLDIQQFTKIIILAILKRNSTWDKNYPLTQEMIDDNVKSIPREIWNWGMKNKTGNLRKLPKEILALNLLKSGKAAIRRNGINFNGALYTCPIAEEEKWFLNVQVNGVRYVDIRYDDRDMSYIYIILDNNEFITAHMIEEKSSNEIFKFKTLQEIQDYQYSKTINESNYADTTNDLNLKMNTEIEKIIKQAKIIKKDSKNNIEGIKNNRRLENENYRKEQTLMSQNAEESFRLQEVSKHEENADYEDDNHKSDLLKKMKILKERKDNEKS